MLVVEFYEERASLALYVRVVQKLVCIFEQDEAIAGIAGSPDIFERAEVESFAVDCVHSLFLSD
jgi:hypothetical protein